MTGPIGVLDVQGGRDRYGAFAVVECVRCGRHLAIRPVSSDTVYDALLIAYHQAADEGWRVGGPGAGVLCPECAGDGPALGA